MTYIDEKLRYINQLMDQVHALVDEIYEGLVDEDFDAVKQSSIALDDLLKEILNSIDNA